MNTAKKHQPEQHPEGYCPKEMPEILQIAKQMKKSAAIEEKLVQVIDDHCSIVDRAEMRVVGIKVVYTPAAAQDVLGTARRQIANGFCGLLERMVGNNQPGRYVAVMLDVKTGLDFTYVIGVEVDDLQHLPAALPPDTITCVCPPGRYGKRLKKADERAKNTISAFSYADFRNGSGYVYDKRLQPFQVFDAAGELLMAYEPVKVPADDEERFDSVGWEIVTLPEIKAVGCTGDGMVCMEKLFAIENSIDWEKAGDLSAQHQYVSFGLRTETGDTGFMGRQVRDFSAVPAGLTAVTRPGGLFVRFYQMQINNDNPSIFYEGARDVLFFNKYPEYELDYSSGLYDLFFSQYEQGVNVYFPIRKKIDGV